jgi:hypothetical protein
MLLKNLLLLCLVLCSAVAQAQFQIEQFKAQVVVTRVTEDTSQLETIEEPHIALGPAATTRTDPKKLPAAGATCVKVDPLEGKEFGENLISRVVVSKNTATAQLIETTPQYVIYAFTKAGSHSVSFFQIGQNPLDFSQISDVAIVVDSGSGPVPGPVDPPPPISGSVAEASRRGAVALNDPATANAMASALRTAITQARGQTLDAQKSIVRTAIETVLLNRKGPSRQKDWLLLWREPVNSAIARENPQQNYLSLIQQAADGLTATNSAGTLPVVTMYSIANCPDCELFKNADVQSINFATVKIVGSDSSVRTYPSFRIEHAGRTVMAEGYHSASQLRSLISQMTVQ